MPLRCKKLRCALSRPNHFAALGVLIPPVVFSCAGGQGEFSNGSIALLRIYEGVLNLNAPTLSARQSATNSVVITWPSPSTDFVLQQNPDLSTTNWTAHAQIPDDNGSIKTVIVAPPAGQMFYRLYHP